MLGRGRTRWQPRRNRGDLAGTTPVVNRTNGGHHVPNVLNWRKLTLLALLPAYGNPILSEFQFLRVLERQPAPVVEEVQRHRLTALLRHAWENTDYYHEVLGDGGVVRDGRVNLDRFEEIPFLTKDIIRQQGDRLRCRVLPKGAKPYRNSTGGSTGEPIQFWQDT